ncbi:MAG: prolipoprotein diacylglyceryl transferase family protein [Aggregatilineales bacterium]
MFHEVSFGPLSLRPYSLILGLGAAIAALLAYKHLARAGIDGRGERVDLTLGALLGGIIGARIVHVLLQWEYFADHLGEALRLSAGGLNWQGAALGGLAGLAIAGRWRGRPLLLLLPAFALAPPVMAAAGWLACAAAACAYGSAVETLAFYPPLIAVETPDIYGIVEPRYNTHLFGILWSLAILALVVAARRVGLAQHRGLWLALGLVAIGMFTLGFLRADRVPTFAGLRADQWLDAGIAGFGMALFIKGVPYAPHDRAGADLPQTG